MLVEYGDEGVESGVEDAIDAIDRGLPRSSTQRVGVEAHVGRLHRTHDVAHADLNGRPRQWWYDVRISEAGDTEPVRYWIYGAINARPRVTKVPA